MTRSELNRRNGFIDGTATVRSYPAANFPDGAKNSISADRIFPVVLPDVLPMAELRNRGFVEDPGLSPGRETAFRWHTVTGLDFGRAIRWSRERGNLAAVAIKKALGK